MDLKQKYREETNLEPYGDIDQKDNYTRHYVKWLEKQCTINGVVSSADYKHIWKLMDELNTIMWESYMIKGKDFGRQEGYNIMGLLEQWAERH